MSSETHEFQAEVKQLLDLVVHSLYSHKDVFLRELVSNASDAIDRRRFAALSDPELAPEGEPAIRLRPASSGDGDDAVRTLAVEDDGIGMSREELVENLGTIARSGTRDFLERARAAAAGGQDLPPELIGRFGVGFYASFMVADEVEVLTRRAGEAGATRWVSRGDGSYRLEDATREAPGTTVLLHLKPASAEEGVADYTDEWLLRSIVKRYSDFVAHPIRLADGDEDLNSRKAIWTRSPDEVSEEEYREFYKHVAHDWSDPLLHVSTRIEGTFEARALLYVPSVAPVDLYHRDAAHRGIQLFVKRVFVLDECRDLMPEWLRFVRGVVDAEDLSLNVSREMLQQDRQIRTIRNHLVKKLLEALKERMRDEPDTYLTFWTHFGAVLKEGLLAPDEKHERILELVMASSTREEGGLTSLDDYLGRMKEGQDAIYVMTGPSQKAVESSPHLEAFRARGIEVLLLTDPVDEVWLARGHEYRGHKLQSVGQGEVDLAGTGAREGDGDDAAPEAPDESAFRELLAALRVALQERVKEVRLSQRLTDSPACLVTEEGDLTPQMVEMLRQSGQEVPELKRVLEINPDHALVARLREQAGEGADAIAESAALLYDAALLAEGGRPEDPAATSRRLSDLLLRALSAPAG